MNIKNIFEKSADFTIKRIIEIFGIILIIFSILLLLSFASYSPEDPNFIFNSEKEIENILGFRGSYTSDIFFQSFGLISYLIPVTLIFTGIYIFRSKKIFILLRNLFYTILYIILGSFFFSFFYKETFWLTINGNGGFVGSYLNNSFLHDFTKINQIVAYYFLVLIILLIFLISINFKLKLLPKLISSLLILFKKKEEKLINTDIEANTNKEEVFDKDENRTQEDIARNTSSESARISTIPGSNTIGIELPNVSREDVYLKEIISNPNFLRKEYKLPIALGKSISGVPIVGDLSSMPHLLIAGTTGSGKSVCINTIILSLLYKHPPEKCKFILIDPKMLELSTYEGLPHLLCPVITEAKKAASVLGWVVKEMESRYRLMTREGVRNIDGYNKKHKLPMPYIVVVVDEMSDLMHVAGKEIEGYIQKLSQMARASGIHIIMATQRPSVDVITGTIKANFPTRISFQVSSKIDSRTILGEQGAEQLLGKGDMLYMSSANKIIRIHAPFVSDEEINKVNDFVRSQAEPDYIDEILNFADQRERKDNDNEGENHDELYDQALEIIKSEGKASTSFLQRKLQIGYNRAARIIDTMEARGEVSKANHVGKREVL